MNGYRLFTVRNLKRGIQYIRREYHTMPLPTSSVFPPPSWEFMKFASRRSPVHSTKGIVACTQPLAAKCGIDILQAGGNCAVSVIPAENAYLLDQPLTSPLGCRSGSG